MKPEKITAGGTFKCNEKEGIIGVVIKYKDINCILTAFHILKAGKCGLEDKVDINGFEGCIIEILIDYDLAVIEISAPDNILEFSSIGKPEIGQAYALKGKSKNYCNIMTLGKTYHYVSFSFAEIPLPGDSGSPIIQNGKVVGILASVFYTNANAIVISLETF
ncbi:MAG: trypsin-like peptidase domain-containing protein [Methanobacterium sp.]|uniref:hypothetical protein n=1 Tax=Methanobacterium sp. TaxID=2164 RepID=UPI003D64E03D|nr:trypsin-like peptidase domain-containing protein [Methanobacterium sp.]